MDHEFSEVHSDSEREQEINDRIEIKKMVEEAMSLKIIAVYADLMQFAHNNNQVVGEKNDYYITLEQLENALMKITKK